MRKFLLAADRIFAIPGWLAMHVLVQAFDNHPWKAQKIPLDDWREHRTGLMYFFDFNFWLAQVALLLVIYFHFTDKA